MEQSFLQELRGLISERLLWTASRAIQAGGSERSLLAGELLQSITTAAHTVDFGERAQLQRELFEKHEGQIV